MDTDPEQLRNLAVQAGVSAGALLLRFAADLAAGGDLDVAHKSSATDPVSVADAAAERAIVERLTGALPDDGILGEEGEDERHGTTGRRWVIDPLDGTVNFLYGQPLWCVSIACVDAAGVLAGAVVHPPSGEVFSAARGGGAWRDEQRLEVTRPAGLSQALIATGFSYRGAVRADWGRVVAGLLSEVRDIRRGGAAALDLAWVAAGRLDGYVEFALQPWDWAAGRLLVEEAGGQVTEVSHDLGGTREQGLVAGSAGVHAALLARVEELL